VMTIAISYFHNDFFDLDTRVIFGQAVRFMPKDFL
jgi:hypothetical protein